MGTPYGLDPVRSPTGGIMLYLYELPQRLPEGFVLVHNLRARTPQRRLGTMGFRVWLEPADTPVSKRHPCACGWASKLPPHYRVIRVSVPDSEREDPDAEGAR
jgi:hypothetical protein